MTLTLADVERIIEQVRIEGGEVLTREEIIDAALDFGNVAHDREFSALLLAARNKPH